MPRAQWNTIGQPAITPSQGESPLLQVTHSPLARLAIHARGGGGGEVLVERKKEREREREREMKETSTSHVPKLSRLLFNPTPPRATSCSLLGRWTINRSCKFAPASERSESPL